MRCLVLAAILSSGLSCKPSSLAYLAPGGASDGRVGVGSLGVAVAHALEAEYRGQVAREPPPVQLVPTDGSELALRALEARVTIAGPLAYTELTFTFHNAEDRVREGRFSIDLPPGASVGRFAMVVDGQWREARVVARERGREVYETFLHRGVDPALLEQDAGNRFSARVFPIPGKADKQLIIGYEHLVAGEYRLPLAGLPAIPRLAISIERDGVASRLDRGGTAPEDLVLPVGSDAVAIAAGEAFVARVVPDVEPVPAPLGRVLVLVDTSASRAPVMGRQVEHVKRLVAALPGETEVRVAAFDHDVTELYHGRAGAAAAGIHALFAHGALGASDLGAALAHAVRSGATRVVLVGDGTPTLGEADPRRLAAVVAGSAIARVDAIQVGASIDRDTLEAIVAAGRAPGAILDGRDPERVARQLQHALAPEQPIAVAGARRVWPATTRGVVPGEPVFVLGLREGPGALAIQVGSRVLAVVPAAAHERRTRRAVARAELAELAAASRAAKPAERPAIDQQLEALALRHEVVSARTSLIVLESDRDELEMLGPRERPAGEPNLAMFDGKFDGGGETIAITDRAPTIDPSSTHQGVVIDRDYRLIPSGRTFEAVIGTAAGAQQDRMGVSFSGSTSLENVYYVDGLDTSPLSSAGYRARAMRIGTGGMLPGSAPILEPAPVHDDEPRKTIPYTGPMREVMIALSRGQRDRALDVATRWQLAQPGEVAAIIALGEASEARGAVAVAARAYGSLADLYPNRAELLRATGERLDRVARHLPAARALAIDAYRRAVRERPDHATAYRLLAYALLRTGEPDEALDLLLEGYRRASEGSKAVYLQDARVVATHLAARHPARRDELRRRAGSLSEEPSLHVVLTWETDANDVDLHLWDRRDRHAYYGRPALESGGELHGDVTTGFGPEMFKIAKPRAFPYRIAAHYYDRGPMGVGLGSAQIVRHDGRGNLAIDDRPFLIQVDAATVELGTIE